MFEAKFLRYILNMYQKFSYIYTYLKLYIL